MYKQTLFIGFMLFAIFFGAGNLIFPPTVGQLSGSNFVFAILGFIVTGVGLPLIGIIAGSFSKDGFSTDAKRVHPFFAIIFLLTIYLTIGPFFAIPRTSMVSYEMVLLPFMPGGVPTQTSIMLFSLVYFVLSFYLALNPNKLVDRVGQILTPLLLITIILLVVKSFFMLDSPITEIAVKEYADAPFFKGFFEGYQTMDTIAAVAFAIIVLNAVRATGLKDQKEVFKQASIAALIAGIGLGAVYLSLGWIGNNYPLSAEEAAGGNLGTSILTGVARLTYGEAGRVLLSSIVCLACLTTAIGLIVAISSYFNEIFPRFSYKVYAIFFTLISFVLASQGLDKIINGAVPVLMIIYPITIVLIILIFIDKALKGMPNSALRFPIYTTIIISILSVVFVNLDKSNSDITKENIKIIKETSQKIDSISNTNIASYIVKNSKGMSQEYDLSSINTHQLLIKEATKHAQAQIKDNIQLPDITALITADGNAVGLQGTKFKVHQQLDNILGLLKFHESSMEWIIPAIVTFFLGLGYGYIRRKRM